MTRRGPLWLGWLAANLALGVVASVPLMTALVFSYFVRANVWGTVSSPFAHGSGEEIAAIATMALGTLFVVVVATLANRAFRRRLEVRGLVFWVATVVLILAPWPVVWALDRMTI